MQGSGMEHEGAVSVAMTFVESGWGEVCMQHKRKVHTNKKKGEKIRKPHLNLVEADTRSSSEDLPPT